MSENTTPEHGTAASVQDSFELPGAPDQFQRLWTPHRTAYVSSDEESLIVHRGEHAFVILNLYPYNPGHLLVCPYRHIPFYDDATEAETMEIAQLTQLAMKVLREVSHNDGFNIGINQGKVGGAGIADHLHQHILPRWSGDTNFLPIIAQTKTMSRTLDDMRVAIAEGFARLS